MPRRRIGQKTFRFTSNNVSRSSLDELARLIDWTEIDCCLVGIYASAKGEASWPPVAFFKAMLLSVWYNLSDVKLADGLDRSLFEEIVRQLDEHGVIVRARTLVDATIIASASIRHDSEARWVGHRHKKPVHGYKAHVATDKEGIVRRIAISPANVHDGSMLPSILPSEPGTVYADMGYDSHVNREAIYAKGGPIGLAKASLQVHFIAIAYNLRRTWRILAPLTARVKFPLSGLMPKLWDPHITPRCTEAAYCDY